MKDGTPVKVMVRNINITLNGIVAHIRANISQTLKQQRSSNWRTVAEIPAIAFDHTKILGYGVERLRNKREYTTVAFNCSPPSSHWRTAGTLQGHSQQSWISETSGARWKS
jgi:hypothetical protein